MIDHDALAADLEDFEEPEKKGPSNPREERIVAGFEEIQRFVEENGRAPEVGADRDIFERIYAIRLQQICKKQECRDTVQSLDHQGLMDVEEPDGEGDFEDIDHKALAAELADDLGDEDITELKHVKTSAEKKAAEQIANRDRCKDFEKFKPVFSAVQEELKSGVRETRPYKDDGTVVQGNFFILSGQKVYIADLSEEFINDFGHKDVRLRAIYDNGTEQDILRRSLQRALNKDPAARRITDPSVGPLFTGKHGDGDVASGTIYVLRSNSEFPFVEENRDVLHKIGVTGGDVKKRIANADKEATYLLAGVEIVATYELYNINAKKFEHLIHQFFDDARLGVEIKDRFGNPVTPKEWFMVPLSAIDELVEHLKDGALTDYRYNPETASLEKR